MPEDRPLAGAGRRDREIGPVDAVRPQRGFQLILGLTHGALRPAEHLIRQVPDRIGHQVLAAVGFLADRLLGDPPLAGVEAVTLQHPPRVVRQCVEAQTLPHRQVAGHHQTDPALVAVRPPTEQVQLEEELLAFRDPSWQVVRGTEPRRQIAGLPFETDADQVRGRPALPGRHALQGARQVVAPDLEQVAAALSLQLDRLQAQVGEARQEGAAQARHRRHGPHRGVDVGGGRIDRDRGLAGDLRELKTQRAGRQAVELLHIAAVFLAQGIQHGLAHRRRIGPVGLHERRVSRRPAQVADDTFRQGAATEALVVGEPVVGGLEVQDPVFGSPLGEVARTLEGEQQVAFVATVCAQVQARHQPVVGSFQELFRIGAPKRRLAVQARQDLVAPGSIARAPDPRHVVRLPGDVAGQRLDPGPGPVLARHRGLAHVVDDLRDIPRRLVLGQARPAVGARQALERARDVEFHLAAVEQLQEILLPQVGDQGTQVLGLQGVGAGVHGLPRARETSLHTHVHGREREGRVSGQAVHLVGERQDARLGPEIDQPVAALDLGGLDHLAGQSVGRVQHFLFERLERAGRARGVEP